MIPSAEPTKSWLIFGCAVRAAGPMLAPVGSVGMSRQPINSWPSSVMIFFDRSLTLNLLIQKLRQENISDGKFFPTSGAVSESAQMQSF